MIFAFYNPEVQDFFCAYQKVSKNCDWVKNRFAFRQSKAWKCLESVSPQTACSKKETHLCGFHHQNCFHKTAPGFISTCREDNSQNFKVLTNFSKNQQMIWRVDQNLPIPQGVQGILSA